MRMKACLGAVLCVAACAGDGDDDGYTLTDTELTFRTGPFEVPVGDSFTCFYTDVYSPRELAVPGASGTQGPGGHHVIAYYADEPRPVGYHECTDEEMTNLIKGQHAYQAAARVISVVDDMLDTLINRTV